MTGEFMIGVFNTSVVTGLSIAAAGVLLRASWKSYNAGCRKRIWIFMAFCFLIPFHLFSFPGAYTAEIPNVVLGEFESQAVNGAGEQEMEGGDLQSTQNQTGQGQAVDSLASESSGLGNSGTELTVADVLFAVWACVGILLTAYYAAGYRKMRGKIRRWSSECEDGHVQEIIREVAAECKLKRIPEVRIMKDSDAGPFTTGVLRNIIILPDDTLQERDLRFILKHELIHCRNHDISWRLFFLAVNIIHWFNPLAWYLRRAMEQDMEIACDEEVVTRASREKRKEYSDVIMSWVERSRYKGSAVSTGYVKGVGFLKRRFDSIFNGGKKKNGLLLAAGISIFALFIGSVIQLQGDKVYAKSKIAIDRGWELRTDVDGDGEVDRVHVTDNNLDGWDSVKTSVYVGLSNGEEAWISYPERWDSYLVTGDLTGNGAADIVLVKIAWGSSHASGELTVLHVEKDATGKPVLEEYPSNFIQNPNLEPKWVDWENYTDSDEFIDKDSYAQQPTDFGPSETACQGAAIIEKDGKTMLRLIYLVDGWTDSSQCIDCIYTEEGWYIEDMQIIYAYGGSKWEEELLGTW
ncbi:MAG: M48 family metalloprotease [Acetatifactor sp.]|nr:M48 family metalloprotease [Acetatifactor sp.]